ncbi:hypothetical protein BJY00DRAFT_60608 [Aspergillus carlsbadensis]|nr:hypothetical protein BJY00DRAFT_60608 [Aspergillus carlsbadensis]
MTLRALEDRRNERPRPHLFFAHGSLRQWRAYRRRMHYSETRVRIPVYPGANVLTIIAGLRSASTSCFAIALASKTYRSLGTGCLYHFRSILPPPCPTCSHTHPGEQNPVRNPLIKQHGINPINRLHLRHKCLHRDMASHTKLVYIDCTASSRVPSERPLCRLTDGYRADGEEDSRGAQAKMASCLEA